MQIPTSDFLGVINQSTAVCNASWSSFEGTLQLLWQELTAYAVAAEYLQSYLKETSTYSNYRNPGGIWLCRWQVWWHRVIGPCLESMLSLYQREPCMLKHL